MKASSGRESLSKALQASAKLAFSVWEMMEVDSKGQQSREICWVTTTVEFLSQLIKFSLH